MVGPCSITRKVPLSGESIHCNKPRPITKPHNKPDVGNSCRCQLGAVECGACRELGQLSAGPTLCCTKLAAAVITNIRPDIRFVMEHGLTILSYHNVCAACCGRPLWSYQAQVLGRCRVGTLAQCITAFAPLHLTGELGTSCIELPIQCV